MAKSKAAPIMNASVKSSWTVKPAVQFPTSGSSARSVIVGLHKARLAIRTRPTVTLPGSLHVQSHIAILTVAVNHHARDHLLLNANRDGKGIDG